MVREGIGEAQRPVGAGAAKPLSYVVIEQEWKDGDTVSLRLPMQVSVKKWEKNHNAVSVDYGPLTFSLKIVSGGRGMAAQRLARTGGVPPRPGITGWCSVRRTGEVVQSRKETGYVNCATVHAGCAPIELRAQAKRIPEWRQDSLVWWANCSLAGEV